MLMNILVIQQMDEKIVNPCIHIDATAMACILFSKFSLFNYFEAILYFALLNWKLYIWDTLKEAYNSTTTR